MQGTCLKTERCMRNYIFVLMLFTFDPGEVAWISFGPKNAACSQNSLDSGWLLQQCSMVSVPYALDQAAVVHDPLHGWVSCFTIAFNDGRKCVTLHLICCLGGWSLWRQISNDVGQHIYIHLNGRILLYVIQGSLTDQCCRDEIGWTRCHTLQDTNATPHRAQVIMDFLPPALQIWLPSIFRRVAKNCPTPVDVYHLTRVLQQVWQSKLLRPSSSPQVSAFR